MDCESISPTQGATQFVDCLETPRRLFDGEPKHMKIDLDAEEKEHAVRAKTAPKLMAHKFRVGDRVWGLRPQPMGTHRTKTTFTTGEVVSRISGESSGRGSIARGFHHSSEGLQIGELQWYLVLADKLHELNVDPQHKGRDWFLGVVR